MDLESKNLFKDMHMPRTMNITEKQKLAKKAKPFTLKEGIMYKAG